MVRPGFVGWSIAAASCCAITIAALDPPSSPVEPGLVVPAVVHAAHIARVRSDRGRGLEVSGQTSAHGRVAVLIEGRRIGLALADARGRWRLLVADPLAGGAREIELVEPVRGRVLDTVRVWLPNDGGSGLDVAFAVRNEAGKPQRPAMEQAPVLRAGFLQQGLGRDSDRTSRSGGETKAAPDIGEAAQDWLRQAHKAYQNQIVPRLSSGGGGDAAARARARGGQERPERGSSWWLGDSDGLGLGAIGEWLSRAQRSYQREVVPRLTGERELGLVGRPTVPGGRETAVRPEESEAARRAREGDAAQRAAEERRKAEDARRRAEEEARRAAADRLAAAEAERRSAEARRRAEEQRAKDEAAARAEAERRRAAELARDAERNAAAALEEAQRRLREEEAQREAARRNADEAARRAEAERVQREREAAAQAEANRLRAEAERRAEVERRAEAERRAKAEAAERERQARAEAERRREDAGERARAEREAAERERREAEANRRRLEAEADATRRARERMARLEPRRDAPDLPERGVVRRVVPIRPLPRDTGSTPDVPERRGDVRPRPERRANPPVPPVRVARPSASPRRGYRVRRVRNSGSVSRRCRLQAGRRIVPPGTYVVRRGDSLWRISRRHYARGHRYKRIYRANLRRVRNPHLIYPCQRLYIPARRRR